MSQGEPITTEGALVRIMPHLRPDKAAAYLPSACATMKRFNVVGEEREAAWWGEWAEETGELRWWTELADGSEYEGRRDLGNVHPGDGHRFRGRGVPMLTGRANYTKYGKLLGVDLVANPDLVAQPKLGFLVAGLYWSLHGCNQLADQRRLRAITRQINGGYTHEAVREMYYTRALSVLSHVSPPPAPVVHPDDTPIAVILAGTPLSVDGDATPAFNDHGAVWMPLRPLAEALGLTIAGIEDRDDGSHRATLNPAGVAVPLDIRRSRGFSPVRQVVEAAGKSVSWDAARSAVVVA